MQANQNLSSKRTADVLIIGGGVIGVCSAYYLAHPGTEVTLVDQGEIGAGCSYGNAGLIVPSHSVPLAAPGVMVKALKWMWNVESPFYLKPRFSLELLSWVWRFQAACRPGPVRKGIPLLRDLGRASLALHEEIAPLEGMNSCYKRNGLLYLYRTREGFRDGLQEARLLEPYGISGEVLDPRAVRGREPLVRADVAGGVYYSEDAHLDPAQFVRSLACLAAKRGVQILTGTEVLGFETSGRRISSVKTTRGEFGPDQVVLATGAWTGRVARGLRLKVPIEPAKGYSITVKRPAACPSLPLLLGEAKVGVTPMGSLLRFAGTLELAGLDFSINQRRVNAIWQAVRNYLCDLEGLELVEIWRGLRPCTPDGLPIIGRSHAYDNLILATGHGMLGVSLGPITGKLVSQIARDEVPLIDLAGLSPERFR